MACSSIVVFTGRPVADILDPDVGGSGDWRLDMARARRADFLVCTRNRHSPDFPPTPEPHRAAFLVARKKDIVSSPARLDRWLIRISDYVECIIPNIWGKFGQLHLRYPVWYTTLEELGIDLATLPPFKPLRGAGRSDALSDASGAMLTPPGPWVARPGQRQGAERGAAHPQIDVIAAQARLDAILAQFDRVPDLSVPTDPLDWDEHGVPR